jgi:hypothetical protein
LTFCRRVLQDIWTTTTNLLFSEATNLEPGLIQLGGIEQWSGT